MLSQGERQRVLIGRALMAQPKLLILDEPCAGLDPVAREHFLLFISSIPFGLLSYFLSLLNWGLYISTINGNNGFIIYGTGMGDFLGISSGTCSGAGDVNGDGFDDVIVGAFGGALPNSVNAGQSYVIFGKPNGDLGLKKRTPFKEYDEFSLIMSQSPLGI